jgi:hypothetical protein
MGDVTEYPVEVSSRLVLKERIKAYLLKKAPHSSTKAEMRGLLLEGLEDVDGTDLADLLKELWNERFIHVTYGNYFYLTDARIAEREKKKPGYRKEVDFYRNGGVVEDEQKKGSKTEPFTNSWCRNIIACKEAADLVRGAFDDNDIQVFRLIVRLSHGDVGHLPVDSTNAYNEEENFYYQRNIERYLGLQHES